MYEKISLLLIIFSFCSYFFLVIFCPAIWDAERYNLQASQTAEKISNFILTVELPFFLILSTLNCQVFVPDHFRYTPLEVLERYTLYPSAVKKQGQF